MNNTELKSDVLFLAGANTIDYTDEQIERNIENEYYKLQELLKNGQRIKWSPNQTIRKQSEVGYTFNDVLTDEDNMHITRVEVSVDGGDSFYQIKRTDEISFKNEKDGSYTDKLNEVGDPKYFIQTTKGISVFPIPATYDINIYYKDDEDISWGSTNEIELSRFAQRLVTLRAAMLYPHITTTRLDACKIEYADLYQVFLSHIGEGGKVIKMSFRQGDFQ